MSDKKRKGFKFEPGKLTRSCCETLLSGTTSSLLKPHRLKQAIEESFAHTSHKRVTRLTGGIVAATLTGLSPPALSQMLELFELNGDNGFRIHGETEKDYFGYSVGSAGDINGDGIDDVIIGAHSASPNGNYSGASYVVFGSGNDFSQQLELSDLNGDNGFKIDGEFAGDGLGVSVSGAGDVNGDGIDDFIIGARGADPNGDNSGASYVVFGRDDGFPQLLELSGLNGSNGFKINGESAGDFSGRSVSGAGDVNGDGIDDLIVGARGAAPNGTRSGASYVIFGSDVIFASPLELSSLNGDNGFKINGETIGDLFGHRVSGAGDVNGDGIADLIIGATRADAGSGNKLGASYVVFGSDQDFRTPIEISNLNGNNGFKISSESAEDYSGFDVSSAGDVNGDGIADLIIGSPAILDHRKNSGASYVVFGNKQNFNTPFELSSLNGNNGFKINGESFGDRAGNSVSNAGDVNGDDIDDLIIGAKSVEPSGASGSSRGASYIVFGNRGGFVTPLALSNLNGFNGFKINGESRFGNSGQSVSGAGDVNGDGIDDLIIGASDAYTNGRSAGATHVVLGSSTIGQRRRRDLLICPGDINNDGNREIAILVRNGFGRAFKPYIVVKDVVSGDTVNEFQVTIFFQDYPKPQMSSRALEVVPDTNNNGAPEVAILDARYDKVQVWDLLTGEWLGIMSFPGQTALDIELVTDQDGNQIPELAHLGEISDSQSGQLKQRVLLNNVLTGSFIDSVGFNNNFVAKDLSVIDDANGDLKIAVLGENKDRDEADVVRIKKLSDGMVDNKLYFGKGWQVKQMEMLSDLNNNGFPEAAVLRVHFDDNRTNVLIKDTQTGEKVSFLGFDPDFETVKMAIVPPIGDSDAEEVAVLSVRSDGSRQKIWVKDSQTNELMSQVFFNPNFVAKDFAVCPDMNGNGVSELAVLGKRGFDRKERVIIKDALTGEEISTLDF